eukprot:14116-Heterococcus_DN1.PRE.1
MGTPLLNKNDEAVAVAVNGSSAAYHIGNLPDYCAICAMSRLTADRDAAQQKATLESDEAQVDSARRAAISARATLLAMLFAVSTLMQIYIGVKCVTFNFTNEKSQGPLMGLGVVWLNVLAWVLREMVGSATKEEGFLQPELHPHRLHASTAVGGHRCDVCTQRCGSSTAYRCKYCDFDLCANCFRKKDHHASEGLLRGDKGIRTEDNLDTMGYFKRALGLSRPEWKLVVCALLCLACNNAATLALPNFQGSILTSLLLMRAIVPPTTRFAATQLDAVVRSDKKRFGEDIALYLGISMTTGLIGGVQSLCFLIVGRKMANAARNKLFKGILSADVAFHDGNSSGSLTSRLSQDVSAMVSPCTTMLGTLFSNIVLLFGGVIMCFATSWRLSMLAFTTVAPIIQITQAYASFSRKLNRDIYAALAEASGLATEALSNVRTVKAFSTEQFEMDRYNQATSVALKKGIKDAVAGAGAYTINNYLDLSASVLILFYGGHLVMEHDERLTAGKLISYQLYWNLINSSYQQLVNIVTSFTRAAGAAQRVFSLLDQ